MGIFCWSAKQQNENTRQEINKEITEGTCEKENVGLGKNLFIYLFIFYLFILFIYLFIYLFCSKWDWISNYKLFIARIFH